MSIPSLEPDFKQTDSPCLPLVVVEGFLGRTGALLWGNFETYLNWESSEGCRREVIFTKVGPVSSLHDRACELYYSLVGGTVDYGEEHSKAHGHSRYGRTIARGLYAQWSLEHPLHFLGHSIGGSTIVKLQHLLKQRHFGARAHPDMIRSINSISAPFRGTQIVYAMGERADAAPAVRSFSLGSFLAKGVQVISYLSPVLPQAFDLHTESRAMSYRDMSLISLLKQLWKSDWAEGRDATPYDVTFEAADEREANLEGEPNTRTYYRSYATYMTRKVVGNSTHIPSLAYLVVAPLYFTARAIGSFDFSSLRPVPSFMQRSTLIERDIKPSADVEQNLFSAELGEEFRANDGVVPLFSQWHPFPCSKVKCQHFQPKRGPEPGVWYVEQTEGVNHLSIVPFWVSSSQQRRYWIHLGRWLREIDSQMI